MIEKLCKDLTSSYDTNILDIEPDIVQQEFRTVSCKNRNNKAGKKVLMELICNHYDERIQKQKPTAKFIGGPKTLTIHWHPVYKKLIYIFGEWHANITDCDKFEKDANTILVEDYLYNLMLTTDVFLDIYFEFISYKNGQYAHEPYVDGRLNELFKKFRKCLQYNTRSDASCQLARVHYFDIRNNDLYEKNPIIDIFWIVEQITTYTRKDTEKACSSFKLLLTKYPEIITLLKELQKDKKILCKFMEKQLEENQYIKKELDKIVENTEIKMLILNFYKKLTSEEVIKYYDILKRISLDLVNYEKISNDILFKSMNYTRLFLMRIMSFFADVYLLARMFKNFDMSEMEKKAYKGSTDQPIHANNIIIYCGNMHAIKYRDFLSSIGFNDIDHSGNLTEDITNQIPNTPKNCLDMRKIKQPLFSYSSEEKKSAQLEREKLEREQLEQKQLEQKQLEQKQREYKQTETERIEREQKQKEFWKNIKEKREKEQRDKEQRQIHRDQKIKEKEEREKLEREQKQKEQDEYEVPKEPCLAIHATPQPPVCWDRKTQFQYHPDRNDGCPKTAKDLFQKYQLLNLPTNLKECSKNKPYPGQQREERERKKREREQREREQQTEKLEKEERERKREKLREQREKLEREEEEKIKREREKLETLIESPPKSPKSKSPKLKSPKLKSPIAVSPKSKSPIAISPKLKSPIAVSPKLKSPKLKSPFILVETPETIIIQKRCCDRPTQFPSRMANCEGTGHTTAARLSYFASFLTNQDSNLDAIIEVRNSATILENMPTFERIKYMENEKDKPYISDHNGIVLYLSTKNDTNFNIISSNLEGLCRQTKNDSHNRINMITNYFRDVIQEGTILVCQEIVLQKLAKVKLSIDEHSVDVVGNEILLKLQTINNKLVFLSDTYTGGIFYDSSVWKLQKTIQISRLYNNKKWAKFSNAYLFHCISTKCVFWVVNIHLKAFAPGSIEHTKDLLNSNKYVNRAHIIELENIISQLVLESNYFRIPIYFAGDYNNKSEKDILVKKAVEKYMNASNIQDYIVEVI